MDVPFVLLEKDFLVSLLLLKQDLCGLVSLINFVKGDVNIYLY